MILSGMGGIWINKLKIFSFYLSNMHLHSFFYEALVHFSSAKVENLRIQGIVSQISGISRIWL